MKRMIEVFTAGCPICEDTLQVVRGMACPSCEVRVLDLRSDPAAQARAKELGVRRVPAVAVGGKLAECCQTGGVDSASLRAAGVGVPL